MISLFLDRMRKKLRSLLGSKSRTTERALATRAVSNPAYCTVVELSSVVRMGIPNHKHI